MWVTKQIHKKMQKKDTPAEFKARFCIIDDDPIVSSVMKARLSAQFPDSIITSTTDPVVAPDHHVYLVDNDFGGTRLAVHLLRQIRELNPNALVIAMSSSLDQDALESLMNGGCNAIYNKSCPNQAKEVFEVIENYTNIIKNKHSLDHRAPLRGILHSLQALIKQWNQRLAKDIDID
jgi:DNA-binding NarL/FixJ family response regulator